MFTGLIQSIGTIISGSTIPGGRVFRIAHGLPEEPPPGASIAVNGVCLTVTGTAREILTVESYFETLKKTTLGKLKPGSRVNLEPVLKADGRLDGHIVQGHVSSIVKVKKALKIGRGVELAVEINDPAGIKNRSYLVPEGSVTLDGVSLTIAHMDKKQFYIQLIGETVTRTTLGMKKPGDLLNLETDILLRGRDNRPLKDKSINMDRMIQWGYA